MNVINADLREILNNRIIKSMSIIDWGKCLTTPSELIDSANGCCLTKIPSNILENTNI